MMAEAGAEKASLSLHKLLSEPDCFGSTGKSYSEGLGPIDMCIKTEPDDEDISHPAHCTEIQGFSGEEMNSEMHLDTDHIKTEIVMVKIMDDANLQLCSNTEVLCPPFQQLTSSSCSMSKESKSEQAEIVVGEYSDLQEQFSAKKINEIAYCGLKKDYACVRVHELSTVACTLSKQCNSETEKNVDLHSPLEGSSSKESRHFSRSCKKHNPNCLKQYICSECGKSFSRGGHLKEHQLIHSGEKPYKCDQCGKSFSHGSTLKLHQLVHSGEKPHKCSECGRCFSQAGHLKEHQVIHSGEKPYNCSECGKSFSHGSTLKLHHLVHSGEKPYKCQCGKNFSRADHLKQHQRIHSGEKPYKCTQCEKCFSHRSTFNDHQRVHSGEKPYRCTECGKSFSRGTHLKEHQLIHSGEKPYKCNECGKSFVLKKCLKNHERTHRRI